MELDKDYAISIHTPKEGKYQAYLHKQTKVEGNTSLGSPLFFSQTYSNEEQAYQEAKSYYDANYAK